MSRAGKLNARRLAKRARDAAPVVPMNRAERREAARTMLKRKPASGVKKATSAEIRAARRELAAGLRKREEALAETRAQIVDPETGRTREEERRSRLWTPRRLWRPR